MTLAVYFCNQCQKVESYVSFPPDRATTGEGNSQQPSSSSSYEDMLSQLYYEKKAFRKN
ncbi:MAG TPA: hypothetical protein VJP79_00500 [Nitrososphaera sp.]|nr:hypothetical protein [Nitrososphaera sp.]